MKLTTEEKINRLEKIKRTIQDNQYEFMCIAAYMDVTRNLQMNGLFEDIPELYRHKPFLKKYFRRAHGTH